MSETLNKIRKVLMGEKLFEKCAQNGVSNEELENRLAMLQNRNCLNNCNLQDMINVCQLNTDPKRNCSVAIDLELGKDEPCHKWYEQLDENCPICFESLREGETEYAGKCGHIFHEACLKGYFNTLENRNYRCPTCRGEVFGKFYVQTEPEEEDEVEYPENDLELSSNLTVRPRTIEEIQRRRLNIDGEQVLLRNPLVLARQDILDGRNVGIYFGEKLVTSIENQNSFLNFTSLLVPLLREKMIDVFLREHEQLARKMLEEWDELTFEYGQNPEDDEDNLDMSTYFEKPTRSTINNIIGIASTLRSGVYLRLRNLNINVSLYDFITQYCLRDEWFLEGYGESLMNYAQRDKFLAKVFLMVPSYIRGLQRQQRQQRQRQYNRGRP
jgi:hypothetical protein